MSSRKLLGSQKTYAANAFGATFHTVVLIVGFFTCVSAFARSPSGGPPPSGGGLPTAIDLSTELAGAEMTAIGADPALEALVSMDLGLPEEVSVLASLEQFVWLPSCDFAAGDLSQLFCFDNQLPDSGFHIIDRTTGEAVLVGRGSNTGHMSGLAWDSIRQQMFASESLPAGGTRLHTVDLSTGTLTPVGDTFDFAIVVAIAADQDGRLFGFDVILDVLIEFDKDTGEAVAIGSLGYPANFAQGMDFDHRTNTCYIFGYNEVLERPELRTCDTTTGQTKLIGAIGSTTPGGLQDWTAGAVLAPDFGDPLFTDGFESGDTLSWAQ